MKGQVLFVYLLFCFFIFIASTAEKVEHPDTVCCCGGIVYPTMQCYDDPSNCDFTNNCGAAETPKIILR